MKELCNVFKWPFFGLGVLLIFSPQPSGSIPYLLVALFLQFEGAD
jgi:hypothetical protein